MASTLPVPTGFRTHYNGVEFDPTHTVTTGFKVTPVESTDGRTTRSNQIYLRVKSHILGGLNDAAVLFARQRLTKYGGILIYGGRGLGPLSINTGRIKDVIFGPKPRLLSLRPLGGVSACEVEWEVEVTVPECSDAIYTLGFLDLSYRVEYHIRKDGRTNRVVTGMLKIPNNRVSPGSTEVLDSPDRYREQITPPVPFWFKRTFAPWKLDEGRTSMSFGWTDEEFGENVLPPGIVDGDVSQRIKQEGPGAVTASLMCSLNGWFVVAAGYDSSVAQAAFWRIVQQLVYDRRDRFRTRPRDGGPPSPVKFIAWDFEAYNPSLLGPEKRCEFSFSYKITNTTLRDAILHSGLWEPVLGRPNDWRTWQTSVRSSALHPRGATKLVFAPADDQIIDLCGGNFDGLKPIGGRPRVYLQEIGGIPFPPVTEEDSWLIYRNYVHIEVDSGLIEMRRLARTDSAKPPGTNVVQMVGGAHIRDVAAGFGAVIEGQWDALLGQPGLGRGRGRPGVRPGVGKGNPPGPRTGRRARTRRRTGTTPSSGGRTRRSPSSWSAARCESVFRSPRRPSPT